jgi:hypothetical protein
MAVDKRLSIIECLNLGEDEAHITLQTDQADLQNGGGPNAYILRARLAKH